MQTLGFVFMYLLAFVLFAIPIWLGTKETWEKRKQYSLYGVAKSLSGAFESRLFKLFLIYAAILGGILLICSIAIRIDDGDVWKLILGVLLVAFSGAYLRLYGSTLIR